ncbi:hypothetical protein JS531_09465 [Bifidobacterium sp. CP2]|uniref:hypothetical protein n=1 Tax=Bifidobacterium sp. CP2 TaxID=2809025 RepID=UPI001BDCC32E|nr:hypothetical protein [Bifidobacterium sp. CP2]MBT1182168.1 hypothetical protein [Bifidobacterium sp. CP2]
MADEDVGRAHGTSSGPGTDGAVPVPPDDAAPTIEFPVVRRRRRGTARMLVAVVVLALVAAGLAIVDQRRAYDVCTTAENEWTEAAVAAVAAGAEREDPPAVCPSNAFGADLRRYASQLDDDAQDLRIRAAELKARRDAEQEDQRKAAQDDGTDGDARSDDGSVSDDLQSAKNTLKDTLSEARKTLDRLDGLSGSRTVSAMLQGTYRTAKNLFDSSGVKDSRYYKAAAVTLQEAVDAANQWIDSQAAKAK